MDIQIVVRGVEEGKDGSVREHAEEKFRQAIDRFEDRVLSVVIRAEDVTGPEKQGIDKRCKVDLKLRHTEVHIEELGDNFNGVINTAMDRLRTVVQREVARNKKGIGGG